MELTQEIKDFTMSANSKALATDGPAGINVVPVSSIRIKGDEIILVNYFMGKTLENILSNENVSLVVWQGMSGYQIKAKVDYQTSGKIYEEVVNWIAETIPDRKVHGILKLSVYEVYDVTPTTKVSSSLIPKKL